MIGREAGTSRSLVERLIRSEAPSLNFFTNHLWNGLTSASLASAIGRIFSEGRYTPGIFHLYSPKEISRYELALRLKERFRFATQILAVEDEEKRASILGSIHSLSRELIAEDIRDQIDSM